MLIKPVAPAEGKPKKKRRAPHVDAIIAAGATATGSLLLYMFTQIGDIRAVVSRLDSVQNVLIDEDGLIRPSQAAIRSEIQIDELFSRLDRLERMLVKRAQYE
jgi:hypothetical protein